MASSGVGPLSMTAHFQSLAQSQGQVSRWMDSSSIPGDGSWTEGITEQSKLVSSLDRVGGNLTLSEEDLVVEWHPPAVRQASSPQVIVPLPKSGSKTEVQRALPAKKPSFPKTASLKGASPGSISSPQPKGLLRSFSDMSTIFSPDQSSLCSSGATVDDIKPPIAARRRHTHRPVIFSEAQVHPAQVLAVQIPPPQANSLAACQLGSPKKNLGRPPVPSIILEIPGAPTRPRHKNTLSSELPPPKTPRNHSASAAPPLTSASVGGIPLCPSPELPEGEEAAAAPRLPLSIDPITPSPSLAREESGSAREDASPLESPGHCPRSRSMSGAPACLSAALGATTPTSGQARLHHSVSMSYRNAGDPGFRWPSSSGALTPRGGSSRGFSPRQPPPPLRLGPLVKALAERDVEAVREAALSVRVSLKGSKENKGRLIQAGGIHSLVQLIKSEDAVTVDHGVTALFNVCRVEGAAEEIAQAGGFEALVGALSASNWTAKENAAAAIFCLADAPESRLKFFEAGAISPLVEVLRSGTLRGQKDAALALFNLLRDPCRAKEVVAAGGVEVLLSLLQGSEAGLEDKAMAVLAFVSKCPEGREVIIRENGLLALIDVLELASQRAREDAVAALFNICNKDVDALGVIAKEGVIPALHKICQSPSERAKAKARALLTLLRNHRS